VGGVEGLVEGGAAQGAAMAARVIDILKVTMNRNEYQKIAKGIPEGTHTDLEVNHIAGMVYTAEEAVIIRKGITVPKVTTPPSIAKFKSFLINPLPGRKTSVVMAAVVRGEDHVVDTRNLIKDLVAITILNLNRVLPFINQTVEDIRVVE